MLCDARTAFKELNKHMSQPSKVDDGDRVGNIMAISKRYDHHVDRFHATEAVEKLHTTALTYMVIVIDFETNQWNASALNGIKS